MEKDCAARIITFWLPRERVWVAAEDTIGSIVTKVNDQSTVLQADLRNRELHAIDSNERGGEDTRCRDDQCGQRELKFGSNAIALSAESSTAASSKKAHPTGCAFSKFHVPLPFYVAAACRCRSDQRWTRC